MGYLIFCCSARDVTNVVVGGSTVVGKRVRRLYNIGRLFTGTEDGVIAGRGRHLRGRSDRVVRP